MKPLISVLMTSYNREKYIGYAIESVLSSTYQNFELIIVDDQSNDRTVEIAQSYAVTDDRIKVYINERNLGDYSNRNRAASYALGKYIKYLDSDDLIYPHGLEVMVSCIEKFNDVAYGVCSPYSFKPYPVVLTPRESYMEHFFGGHHFDRAPGSLIINREIFMRENGFSGQRMVGDFELLLNLSIKYNVVLMPMYLYWARKHDNQESAFAYNYKPIRENVLRSALESSACPLSQQEKKKIRNILLKKRIFSVAINLMKRVF